MYVLFNGQWLPPSKPEPEDISEIGDPNLSAAVGGNGRSSGRSKRAEMLGLGIGYRRTTSSVSNRSTVSTNNSSSSNNNAPPPNAFSPETVAASSKSFLEVLHLLTLQVHTLEDCSNLHVTLPFLDHEQKDLSSSIDINSYITQMVYVPDSLLNVWALQCSPEGPLPSMGSGEGRGSVLGLLIALYEHRDNAKSITGVSQTSAGDDHGGARVLSADGLKWLLRFISALVDGADSVAVACESASSGIPVVGVSMVSPEIRAQVKEMLAGLPELWPGTHADSPSIDASGKSAASEKNKEAQKAAQARALAKMKKLQSSFAASIANNDSEKPLVDDADEENLCIICKCDDADGDNGAMGYLGHVQRSRVAMLASKSMMMKNGVGGNLDGLDIDNIYRVVGDKGCQVSYCWLLFHRLLSLIVHHPTLP
jgi:hypothetical protein